MIIIRPNTSDAFIVKENFEDKIYLKHINLTEDDIWLDCGANIGAFTLSIFDKVKEVISYEPERKNFRMLTENIDLNDCSNVYISEKAIISTDSKTVDFYENLGNNKGQHSILKGKNQQKINVHATNINKVIKRFKINKIKMDVEGAEYELIKNIEDWTPIKEIIFEYHFDNIGKNCEKKYNEVIQILKDNNFKVRYKKQVKQTKFWVTIVYGVKK